MVRALKLVNKNLFDTLDYKKYSLQSQSEE